MRALKRLTTILRRTRRAVFKAAYAPAAIALVIVVLAGIFAEHQNRQVHSERLRNDVLDRVSLIRAKLRGNINGNIQLARGLVATLSTEPDMTQERFAQLVGELLEEGPQITHVAAAPDLVVEYVYPLAGNEKALGLDYRENAEQREAALRVRDRGELVLAGPVDLVQGGRGVIARYPVFTDDSRDANAFWGIVSVVIDVERLYSDSGLLDQNLPIEVAIVGKDAQGNKGQLFYGPSHILNDQPVWADVALPAGSWRIAAVPRNGWDVTPPNAWLLRLLVVFAGAFIVVPILITGRLVEERQKNIGELRRRGAQLSRLSQRLELALQASAVGVWEMKLDSERLVWDNRMNELYGFPADGRLRTFNDWRSRLHPDDATRAEEDFRHAVDVTGRYNSDFRVVLPDGTVRHFRAIAAVYREGDGSSRIVGVNWDVTADVELNNALMRAKALTEARNAELEEAKARIEHTSLHDSLTGLPNRRYLDAVLEKRSTATAPIDGRTALLHVDLDRFKQINDTLGHAAGDAMLVHAAAVLKSNIGPNDFVARVGGDEFVIVCNLRGDTQEARTEAAAELANRLIEHMRRPVPYMGHECRFGVSVGIAIERSAASDARRLMVNADIALYRAKSRGRNRFQFFNEALQAEIVATKRTADEVLSAIENGEFIAHYQPQFDARSLDIVGVEALARWRHPQKGVLRPNAFLQVAEELNVVPIIDRMILEQAVTDFETWSAGGLGIPRISVNVSARRLRDEELIDSLGELNIAPGTVSFELVESIFLDERDDFVAWNVDKIKELGIDIEIDDFGTGYASIVSLMKLRPFRFKIDRQLIMPVARSPAQRQLVRSIIDIGKALDIEILAEGVETRQHAHILERLGCDALQGYAFARPMEAADLQAFVETRAWRKAS